MLFATLVPVAVILAAPPRISLAVSAAAAALAAAVALVPRIRLGRACRVTAFLMYSANSPGAMNGIGVWAIPAFSPP